MHKREVKIEDIRALEQAGNDLQRALLGGWLCTGMSGDLLKLKVTPELLEQLDQDPLPDVVLIEWTRSKTRGREQRALRKRYAGFIGIWAQHLRTYVKRKNLQPGDPLFVGHNKNKITQAAITSAWKDMKFRAGIKENGERFSPHVLRGYCLTTMVKVKDSEFGRYLTGKKADPSIVTYYNAHKDMVIEVLQAAKRYIDPYAAEREENEILRKQQESIDEKIARLDAESRQKDNLLLEMREELRELKKARAQNPAQAIQEEEGLTRPVQPDELQRLKRENQQLRSDIEEIKKLLTQAAPG